MWRAGFGIKQCCAAIRRASAPVSDAITGRSHEHLPWAVSRQEWIARRASRWVAARNPRREPMRTIYRVVREGEVVARIETDDPLAGLQAIVLQAVMASDGKGNRSLDLPFAEREAATRRWNFPALTLLTRD
jgi:hypothetical protein